MYFTFTQRYTQLEQDALHSAVPTRNLKGTLSLSTLKTAPEVFQPRELAGVSSASGGHIKQLTNALKNTPGNILDPIEIWWSGKAWYVVDGHHRLEAYRRHLTAVKGPKGRGVPVVVFEGALRDAVLRSIECNSKDKLPMGKDDKLDSAWRLVCLGALSKRRIALAAGVGERTVANMRQAFRKLVEMGKEGLAEMTWKDALATFQGTEPGEYDEEWIERQAKVWASRIGKAFGTKFGSQPDVAALALTYYSEELPEKLTQSTYWPVMEPDSFENLGDSEF